MAHRHHRDQRQRPSNLQGSGTTYTFDVTPTADGDVTVAIMRGVAATTRAATRIPSRRRSRASPTGPRRRPPWHPTEPDPTSTNPIPFTVTFSESVNGFTAGDIIVLERGRDQFARAPERTTPSTWSRAAGNVEVSVSVPAGVAEDAATNGNRCRTPITRQFNGTTVTTHRHDHSSDPTNDSPIQFTVLFGEAVTGFELADINVTNGTAVQRRRDRHDLHLRRDANGRWAGGHRRRRGRRDRRCLRRPDQRGPVHDYVGHHRARGDDHRAGQPEQRLADSSSPSRSPRP